MLFPEPNTELERIEKQGFFVEKEEKLGVIGIERRILDLISELVSYYPHNIRVKSISHTKYSPHSMEIAQERFGEEISFVESEKEIFTDPDIRWVFIENHCVSSNFNHFQLISSALQHGKHVFCEKPYFFSFDECIRLHASLSDSPALFLVGFIWRTVPFYFEIFNLLRNNVIGMFLTPFTPFLSSSLPPLLFPSPPLFLLPFPFPLSPSPPLSLLYIPPSSLCRSFSSSVPSSSPFRRFYLFLLYFSLLFLVPSHYFSLRLWSNWIVFHRPLPSPFSLSLSFTSIKW